MSEFGDDMRAWKQRKQQMRARMPECGGCGTYDGYKVHQSAPCPRCGSTSHMTADGRKRYAEKQAAKA